MDTDAAAAADFSLSGVAFLFLRNPCPKNGLRRRYGYTIEKNSGLCYLPIARARHSAPPHVELFGNPYLSSARRNANPFKLA
ncbi:MAG: hypothetical protein DCC52_18670 [Chloroflexi bacterium]|nr:MAG: hypothetical protein DCC52_18670 [Chloroflexota bacterium]